MVKLDKRYCPRCGSLRVRNPATGRLLCPQTPRHRRFGWDMRKMDIDIWRGLFDTWAKEREDRGEVEP